MNKQRQLLQWGAAAVALVFATPAVRAEQTAGQRAQPASSRAARGRPQVRHTFVRNVADGCRYSATVTGTVGAAGRGGERYRPNLRVTAELRCPARPDYRYTDRIVMGAGFSREQLEQAIEERASLVTVTDGRACHYTREFALRGGEVVGESVWYSCGVARGGGPGGRGPGRRIDGVRF